MPLPGYRDRIVHIHLDKKVEGGANFGMTAETVEWCKEYGRYAARQLLDGLDNPEEKFEFGDHRWRRLLAATDAINQLLQEVEGKYREKPTGDDRIGSLEEFLEEGRKEFRDFQKILRSYEKCTPNAAQHLAERWKLLAALAKQWEAVPVFDDDDPNISKVEFESPRPPIMSRFVPRGILS